MNIDTSDSPPSPQNHLLHTTWILWREGGKQSTVDRNNSRRMVYSVNFGVQTYFS